MGNKPLTKEERCQEMVSPPEAWGAFHQHQCYNKAVITRDGKRYCKIHDPEYIKEKNKIRQEKSDEKWAKRRLELYAPMLLKACKDALEASHNPVVEKILMEAIAKAEAK